MSLDELKTWLLHKAEISEASLRADPDIDDQTRQAFLQSWSEFRKGLAAAATFHAVAESMGPWSLYRDHWFSLRGRSNRAEFLAVVIFVLLMAVLCDAVSPLLSWPMQFLLVLAFEVVPIWLLVAASVRRAHDLGLGLFGLVAIAGGLGLIGVYLERRSDDAGLWFGLAASTLFLFVLGALPGSRGENRYDPKPHPGPSL